MSARDHLLDGASIPWDFLVPKKAPAELPPPVTRTPSQERRRRLIVAGVWRRP